MRSMKLTCAVGIATYERTEVLIDCLRHLARSTRLPEEIIIADASANAAAARANVKAALEGQRLPPFRYLQAPPSLPAQRNQILDQSQSEVILFPDDDTLVSPEFVERIMDVYEADSDRQVGGVDGVALENQPAVAPGGNLDGSAKRGMRARLRPFARRLFLDLQTRFVGSRFPDWSLVPVHDVPDAIRHLPVTATRSLYGCVMSYRTSLARQYRFNERLKRYAFLEDFEMSYRISKRYALVRRLDAFARHLKVPGGRMHPSLYYFVYLVNLAYVARTALDGSPDLLRYLKRHARRYVLWEALFCTVKHAGLSGYRGARAGLEQARALLDAPLAELPLQYERVMQEALVRGRF